MLFRYIDDYRARKDAEAVQKRKREADEAAAKAADGNADADAATDPSTEAANGNADVAEATDTVLETIMGLLSERAEAKGRSSASAATDQFLNSLPGPPPRQGDNRHPSRQDRGSERDAERRAEAELEKERKRDRHEAEKKLRTAEMNYTEALRAWEKWERWVLAG